MTNKDLEIVKIQVSASQQKKQAMEVFLNTLSDIDKNTKQQIDQLKSIQVRQTV